MAKVSTKDILGVESVPPFMPIVIEDWCGDDRVQDMNMSDRGIYLSFLLEQWRSKNCPATPYKLANVIGAGLLRYETVKGWLERWASRLDLHYEVHYCPKHASVAGTRAQQGEYGKTTDLLQQQNILTTKGRTACDECVVRLYQPKLRNLRFRVKNGGSDAPNLTEPNSTEVNKTERKSLSGGRSEFDSVGQDGVSVPESQSSTVPETSPVPESVPAQPQNQVSDSSKPEHAPVSAAPKKVLTDAEKCVVHLFNLLDKPKRFRTDDTYRRWSRLMEYMLVDTGLECPELLNFIKWAVTENIDSDNRRRSSAEWIPVAKDPCQTLCEHSTGDNPWLLQLWKVKKKLASVRRKQGTSEAASSDGTPALRTMDDLCATMQGAGRDAAIAYIKEHAEEYRTQHPDWYQHWKEFELV